MGVSICKGSGERVAPILKLNTTLPKEGGDEKKRKFDYQSSSHSLQLMSEGDA